MNTDKPRVFAVQAHTTLVDGKPTAKYDTSDAERFGPVTFLLGPTAAPWAIGIVPQLHEQLCDYRGQVDYLLLVGNPGLIGMTCAIAAVYGGGHLQVLQWDGREKKYRAVTVDLMDGWLVRQSEGEWRQVWK